MFAAESDDLFFCCARAFFKNDEGCDLFAIERVGDANGCGCGHCWMFVENFVNLARVDVFAAANNHVGLAVNYVEEAVSILITYIARVKPSVPKSMSGCFLILVIAL